MKNKISFKKFNIIFILLVFIVILSSMYYQYNAFNKIIIKNFENENYNKSFAIREKFRLIFDKLQYNFIKSENDNLKKLDELYEIYKNEKHDLNLTKIEKELNKNVAFGKYQVFLINKDYIIENASYKKEIGFDLGQFKIIRELFDNLYAKKIKIDISSPKLDEESRLKRYLIKLSDDEKYILQLGFYLDNNEIKKQLSYLITDAIKINLYLASEFFIQEINFKDQKLKNTSHFNKSAKTTKELLTELNLVLKNEEIEKLLQKDSKKEDISLNRSLEKLLPLNKGLVSYINKEENRISFSLQQVLHLGNTVK